MDRPIVPTPPPPRTAELPDRSPAEPARPRTPWYLTVAAYAVAAGLTVGILVVGLRLNQADFHAPFTYSEDALLILPFVEATLEQGGHWRNTRLGAPGVLELHDFPVVDHLHFAVIWVIGQFVPDTVVVFNLYYLLTYPLTTIAAMYVLRSFGLSMPAAGTGGLLYAFQPYHYLRGEVHYFLSAYYVIPLTLMVGLWLCQGRLPFFRATLTGYRFAPFTRDTLVAVVIALATASAGAYYAFFACLLLSAAGVIAWVGQRTWRAGAAGAAVVAVIVIGGVANHLPAYVYKWEHGTNSKPTQRWAEESEMYGMKIIQLVLPVAEHNDVVVDGRELVTLSTVRARYVSEMRPLMQFTETEFDPMGLIAAAGFVGLLAHCVLPTGRAWPLGPLAGLAATATLFGTVGGFGDVFNLLVTAQVRCHNRISIYIAFMSLFAVCWVLDRWFDRRTGWARRLRWPAFVALGTFGIWDQTDSSWFPQTRPTDDPSYVGADERREQAAAAYRADHDYFTRVEELLPGRDGLLLPVRPVPGGRPLQRSRQPRGDSQLRHGPGVSSHGQLAVELRRDAEPGVGRLGADRRRPAAA